MEQSTGALERDLGPLLSDSRKLMAELSRLSDAVGNEAQLKRYEQLTKDAAAVAADARQTMSDAKSIAARVKSGQGTVGAFVMDEAVYDDFQEFLRDIKHNPWKLFWRD